MDANIQRALHDKLYDKRKGGALDLERLVREALVAKDFDKISKIVQQLCHEYAYAVHQPHARNGGLIGLAAASIALGPEVARYLEEIVPPVLACFTDQDARVRYYACESMYNIAKVAKGEILLYFNDIFDSLCKLAADSELSVKNGAELLDRLIKDIVSESAATYVSVLNVSEEAVLEVDSENPEADRESSVDLPTAFSLSRFIPLLKERIHVLNPFTRTFLVSWITLLDSIPDLELVTYLPAFLGGLFKFLSDPNRDVHVATQGALDRFLGEIKKIARIKKGIEESRKSAGEDKAKQANSSEIDSTPTERGPTNEEQETASVHTDSSGTEDVRSVSNDDWVPGQDVQVDHPKILEILVQFLDPASEEEIQLAALHWIDSFFEICPENILPFVPNLLSQVLPAMASDVELVRKAANRVNNSLMEYIMSLTDEPATTRASTSTPRDGPEPERRDSTANGRTPSSSAPREGDGKKAPDNQGNGETQVPAAVSATAPAQGDNSSPSAAQTTELDYAAAVNALTLQFLNEHEATRVAALTWLIMLHSKAPRKVLAINDGTFPALLKTLSDPAEAVVTRDLQLLSQISRNSEDKYFTSFMVNLLQLFCTDRRLLETRGNLIIRQLCVSLSAERIYRTLADCLEKDEDVEFASIMVQNLNNNLITAPELADLRKRLRNLETRDGQTFFVTLFRSWCHNAVATFSLCLLAQAYEQAYNLLQIFAELEMTVNMLIQIDKLVQLLESPVFTYLRLQLLEPEKYPHLYKCLYGLLMLLPQSSAFAALKNRLNSVSAIGYLHIAPRTTPTAPAPAYDRPNRLKSRDQDNSGIRWVELLDKFKSVQEKARRLQRLQTHGGTDGIGINGTSLDGLPSSVRNNRFLLNGQNLDSPGLGLGLGIPGSAGGAVVPSASGIAATGKQLSSLLPQRPGSAQSIHNTQGQAAAGNQRAGGPSTPTQGPGGPGQAQHKPRSSLSNLGRLTGGVGGRKLKK
ncbi:ARM repeat-containing protein [Xylona heveae TC161]|uniref:ARM repeat-containing protein n=1 Tax=Xylona heveae (strain CBS 132557 / TC161) TaxID=1328760 RepID=A0A165G9F1_XYLHT|nr:ARM repeat-containing protein [Xylona heveae TC161]KZF21901.1 ARM repeat-containing protein [Xylona heveae TC161]